MADRKAWGKQIAAWRLKALAAVGPNGTDHEIATWVNTAAKQAGKDYSTTAEDIRAWRITASNGPAPKPPRGKAPGKAPVEPAAPSKLSNRLRVDDVVAVRLLADQMGGIAHLRAALDALERITAPITKVMGMGPVPVPVEGVEPPE